jgi:predicted Zn-dependent protease
VRYQKRNYAEAERGLRETIALQPDSGMAYVLLGQTQLKMNRGLEAIANMRRAVEVEPTEYRYKVIYGMVLASNGDCRTAITQFSQALQLRPGEACAQMAMDRCRAVENLPVSQAPLTAQPTH